MKELVGTFKKAASRGLLRDCESANFAKVLVVQCSRSRHPGPNARIISAPRCHFWAATSDTLYTTDYTRCRARVRTQEDLLEIPTLGPHRITSHSACHLQLVFLSASLQDMTSLPYFRVKLSSVCLMFAFRKK